MRYVTIKDIARALGISKSTVSRALSADSRNVSAETIRKVAEAAERMGYTKNEMAVNLRNRRTKTIGIVVPEAVTSFYLQFMATVQRILQPYGYRIILTLSDEDFMTERATTGPTSNFTTATSGAARRSYSSTAPSRNWPVRASGATTIIRPSFWSSTSSTGG